MGTGHGSNENEPSPVDDDAVAALALAVQESLAAGKGASPIAPGVLTDVERLKLNSITSLLGRLHRLRDSHDNSPDGAGRDPLSLSLVAAGDHQRHFGRFEIERLLGYGGHGVVFLGFDPVLGRQVAIKIPRPEVLVDSRMRERFLREARAAAMLDHPHILPIYEASTTGDVCFIAMAYCPGGSLAEFLEARPGKVSPRALAQMIAQLADALNYTHRRGVLHCDLKPANVLLFPLGKESADSGRPVDDALSFVPKLTDFGLAKVLEESAVQTRTSLAVGTPLYMAPEQARGGGDALDGRCDIHALGVIMYEVLTGHCPFAADSVLDVLEAVRNRRPPSPHKVKPSVAADLSTICLKCLEKRPADRYTSAAELADDLKRFLNGSPIRTRPLPRPTRAVRWARHSQILRFAAALLLAVAATALALRAQLPETPPVSIGPLNAAAGPLKTAGHTQFSFGSSRRQTAACVLIDSNDRIVLVGDSWQSGQWQLALSRLHLDETVDQTFGTDGQVLLALSKAVNDGPYCAVIDSDGRIVVGGNANHQCFLARHLPNGSLDRSFGSDGIQRFGPAEGGAVYALAIDRDKSIVAAGTMARPQGPEMAVARLSGVDGSLIQSFGKDGIATFVVQDVVAEYARGVAIQNDGKIAIVGSVKGPRDLRMGLARLNPNGTLDKTFGKGGVSMPNDDRVRVASNLTGLVLQSDGSILACGSIFEEGDRFAVVKFNSAGNLDSGFADRGISVVDFGGTSDYANAFVRQPDGRLVVTGYATLTGEVIFATARYLANGTLDPDFGAGGRVITSFFSGADMARGLALRPDGRIVVAGVTGFEASVASRHGPEHFGLVQLNGAGQPIPPSTVIRPR